MMRRTKIVATLGPATSTADSIEALIKAGVNVVRLNFSHGTAEEHIARSELVREMARKVGRIVGILGDLQGPKLRISRFIEGKVFLESGAPFILDAALASDAGTVERVGLGYKQLVNNVTASEKVSLEEGRSVLSRN